MSFSGSWWLLAAAGTALLAGVVGFSATREPPQPYVMLWGGDTFLGDRGQPLLDGNGYRWPFELLPSLGDADLTVINAEAPLTDRNVIPPGATVARGSTVAKYDIFTSRGRVTRYVHHASPAAAPVFAELGVDVAALANNHSMDQGVEGLADSRRAFEAAGIRTVGAGTSFYEALQPVIVSTPFGEVGIFAFAEEGGTAPDAARVSEVPGGVLALTLDNLEAAQQRAQSEGVEWMVAAVHWGDNYQDVVPEQERWAERLEAKGFDLVVGTGPHIVQRVDRIDRAPILYSIGNLVFQSAGRFDELELPGYGLLARTVLTAEGFEEVELTCIRTDNKQVAYQPRVCTADEAAGILPTLTAAVEVSGPTGRLRWPDPAAP